MISYGSNTPTIHFTSNGTAYLKEPGVACLAQPSFFANGLRPFIDGFGDLYDSDDYITDVYMSGYYADSMPEYANPYKHTDGEHLVKTAGQLCYLSFGEKRTRDDDMEKYLHHIMESGHGSVLEHANYTMLFYGIDRAVTHELVRHRAGFAYSQVSQRYVDGKSLRFVERPEYQEDSILHTAFEQRIDRAALTYNDIAGVLLSKVPTDSPLKGTERRKAVNQAARSSLPNETEAPIIVTGNVRAWRNFLDQRASRWADTTIRRLAYETHGVLVKCAPLLFGDYQKVEEVPYALASKWRKV